MTFTYFLLIGVIKMLSLVGIRAVDISKAVGASCYTGLTSYNKVIAGVIPAIENEYDLIDFFFSMCSKLRLTTHTIIRKPTTRKELVELFRELETEIQNEEKTI